MSFSSKKLNDIVAICLVSISWIVNVYPICRNCSLHLKDNPDIIKSDFLAKLTRVYFETINTTATIVAYTYKIYN